MSRRELTPARCRDVTHVPRRIALVGLVLTLAAVQFSIAIAQIFLPLALVAWVDHARRRAAAPERAAVDAAADALRRVDARLRRVLARSRASLTECKQLVLLLLVPLTYEIVDEALGDAADDASSWRPAP